MFTNRFAGELLAIEEFNESDAGVKIDCWRGIGQRRPFPEAASLNRMFIAHDLDAISKVRPQREPKLITVDEEVGATG
jgi:hypothetical protein